MGPRAQLACGGGLVLFAVALFVSLLVVQHLLLLLLPLLLLLQPRGTARAEDSLCDKGVY